MTMRQLAEVNAEKYLLRSADIIKQRGLSKCLTRDPSGTVNMYGAIYGACGADINSMPFDSSNAEEAGVPEKFQVIADEIALYLESFCEADDLTEWTVNENIGQSDAVKKLASAAVRLIIFGDVR